MEPFRLDRLLTLPEAADFLHVHPVTLRDWVRAGRIGAIQVGRVYRFEVLALQDWLDQRRRKIG